MIKTAGDTWARRVIPSCEEIFDRLDEIHPEST